MKNTKNSAPENLIRGVVDACADCDSCRFLMDESCLFFPELYRLWDREKDTGHAITKAELSELVQYCTACGLCPCPDIRADIILARSGFIEERGGLPFKTRVLADIQNVGKTAAHFPRLINMFHSLRLISKLLRQTAGIHSDRRIPAFPDENFFQWAAAAGLTSKCSTERKVALFAGCTGAYLFPRVPKAAVSILKQSGIGVYIPPQKCCGMPTFLEGDRGITLERVRYNLASLSDAVRDQYDIVCSCPTCGYFFKILLSETAYYSHAYQSASGAAGDEIILPAKVRTDVAKEGFIRLKKIMYQNILKDEGYFSQTDPLDRIRVSESVFDLGEYLANLYDRRLLNISPGGIRKDMVYYPPCHQREQKIGTPYEKLLRTVPGLNVRQAGSSLDCCGMGGSLGFKADFHEKSLELGRSLIEKLRNLEPDGIITDCLSCRLQFQYAMDVPVFHPAELLFETD